MCVSFFMAHIREQAGWITMLVYATIFIVSIIVAVVSLVLYKVISDTSRSVYSSKEPIDIIPQQDKSSAYASISDRAFPSGQTSHSTPRNMAQTFPAMPTEAHDDWSVREKGSHCSLYDVNPVEAPVRKKRNTGWPQRVDKQEAGGSTYKVTRKRPAESADTEDGSKPWGW